jgi:hypothetical protein
LEEVGKGMLFPVGSPSHSKPVTQQLETDIASTFKFRR